MPAGGAFIALPPPEFTAMKLNDETLSLWLLILVALLQLAQAIMVWLP
jgi:hypothetical protein